MKKFIIGSCSIFLIFALAGCSTLERFGKNINSDVSNGLNRTVSVYSQDGKLIRTYTGKLDIRQNKYGNEVLFDLNGKRIIINNAVVVTEEK